MTARALFFTYTMDCERIAQESYLKNGAPSWEISERAILGMAEVLQAKGMKGGFYPTPATAERQADVFHDLAAQGFEIGLQLHCDSFRNGEYTQYLGQYDRDEQQEILTLAKADWEAALGMRLKSFRSGFLSANDHTFPILAELGVKQSSSSKPGRYGVQTASLWWGACPFAHHASARSRLICGDLDLYEIPVTRHPRKWSTPSANEPYDLRPDSGHPIALYYDILDEAIDEMIKMDPPIKTIVGITHNTVDYLDQENPKRVILEAQIDYVRHAAAERGLTLVPATLAEIHQAADKAGAF
jgi:peptidoglycan/xylan/chitin deacetylase (PgdA/CDA1 family)